MSNHGSKISVVALERGSKHGQSSRDTLMCTTVTNDEELSDPGGDVPALWISRQVFTLTIKFPGTLIF